MLELYSPPLIFFIVDPILSKDNVNKSSSSRSSSTSVIKLNDTLYFSFSDGN